jgi:hypothetical protein
MLSAASHIPGGWSNVMTVPGKEKAHLQHQARRSTPMQAPDPRFALNPFHPPVSLTPEQRATNKRFLKAKIASLAILVLIILAAHIFLH